jgi:hypothetical protein
VDIGISVRDSESNPWLARLLKSLETISAGMLADVYIEKGEQLTKVEKRIRLFRRSQARYLCLIEDDAEVLHDGWLVNLICRMSALPNIALLNPAEAIKHDEKIPEAMLIDSTLELAYCCGFCMVIDRESGIEPDVRVQTLDDLYLSLQARAKGWRCAKTDAVIVRHTKAPWAQDGVQPGQQADRSRFGAEDAYYDVSRHQAKRLREAAFLIEQFGDVARMVLPKELLAVVEPKGLQDSVIMPGCSRCYRHIELQEDYAMVQGYPVCSNCWDRTSQAPCNVHIAAHGAV